MQLLRVALHFNQRSCIKAVTLVRLDLLSQPDQLMQRIATLLPFFCLQAAELLSCGLRSSSVQPFWLRTADSL